MLVSKGTVAKEVSSLFRVLITNSHRGVSECVGAVVEQLSKQEQLLAKCRLLLPYHFDVSLNEH